MHCRECQRRKSVPQKPPGLLVRIPPASAPFQRISIDLHGKFPRSTKGNKWIIIRMDYLSRFTVTKALPTADAEEVAKFITEEIVLKHGAPRTILTDRGKVFESKLVKELHQLCISKHRKTNGYHPQTNGLNERFNKTLADMLSIYVEVEQTNRDEILPFAYNTAKQETMGYTPFYFLHGRDAETTLDTVFPYSAHGSEDDYVKAQEHILTNDIEKLPSNALAGATYNVGMDKKDTTLDSPGEIVPYRGLMTQSKKRNVKEL
ncbi:transposon Ty3-I Gag-Pol polyprotein [Trichonephila inaurata madagascariensis]|uniref:Transposon Ty3-I Gag-Pol polyprotein n=1 Tax=Trichonephila inaurata madagascariensis TaxID=2747483 RepID=A0A8X6YMU9_9ARAC|nr:transposon Ty3-I Gag-Pol polyprotein [Trichonephila inaurata madagascariensis]